MTPGTSSPDTTQSPQQDITSIIAENQRLKDQIRSLTSLPSSYTLTSLSHEKSTQKLPILFETLEKMQLTMDFLWREVEAKDEELFDLRRREREMRLELGSGNVVGKGLAVGESSTQENTTNGISQRIQQLNHQRLENLEHQVTKKLVPRLFLLEQTLQNVLMDVEGLKLSKDNEERTSMPHFSSATSVHDSSALSQKEVHLNRARERIMKLRHEFKDLIQYSTNQAEE